LAYFPLEMVAGKYATDHNDLIFLCYVTASFWAWFEYSNSQKHFWLIFIGVFAGCAVLVKWLPGLLVFGTWFISLGVDNRKNWFTLKSYLPILFSAAIAFAVFLPWQIYIFNAFPLEAKAEYMYSLRHFSESIEGHGGPFWFHFTALKDLYGSGFLVPVFLVLGLFFLIKKSDKKIFSATIITAIVFTYGFYSFAETKMIAFCMIVSPFFFLGLGALVDTVIQFLKRKIKYNHFESIFRPVALLTVCFFLLNFNKIRNYHTNWKPHDNCNRIGDLNQMAFNAKLNAQLGNNNYVVFNAGVRVGGNISVMFYTNYVAYEFLPTEKQIAEVKSKNYKIAVYDNAALPEYILNDPEIVKIKL
ncbi:MAG: ArnT family glycosyltransferase, partial [Bacteroidia bacterium]